MNYTTDVDGDRSKLPLSHYHVVISGYIVIVDRSIGGFQIGDHLQEKFLQRDDVLGQGIPLHRL